VKEHEIEDENEEDVVDDLEETQEEIEEEVDKGEILVLRRVLSGQKGAKEEQRENIFHSQCTIQRKVCSMIIDGGSCTNVISLSMIKKLALQAMAHPYAYSV